MNPEVVCLIYRQVIDRIQWVHSRYIVHLDIKPDNFVIGRKGPNIIYLIDFGLRKNIFLLQLVNILDSVLQEN